MSGRERQIQIAFRPLNVTDRWDSAAIAAALTPEQRLDLSVAALDLVAAWSCTEVDHLRTDGVISPISRAGHEAANQATEQLLDAFVAMVPRDDMLAPNGQPRIPQNLGLVCERCGCTENDACEDGCSWVTDCVCRSCAAPWEVTPNG
ncbi:hypothetical protein [Beijerinckia sp. L45]|uniref:hypothetical protein n=1 Tax=Beijerinckia sp. L45 TaxID=1641855 RepID=UPI00131AC70E|nr:hypothetical protein [Beijerinckia sp. L45]